MSGTMKDAIKALNASFSATAAPYPLPDELCAAIESFLDRYDNIDDHDSQRFHEDLYALYLRHIASNPEKHAAFLAVLRLARPAITGESRLTTWYDLVVGPTIERVGHKRHELEDAREFVQSILVYDGDEDRDGEHARLSSVFLEKLLQAYLARTDLSAPAAQAVSADNEHVAHELEAILVGFGRKMPKTFMIALDHLFIQRQYRVQALNLLSAFVRLQPPHLHLILETPLLQNLEKCLLIDTSSTVIDLALVVLIMFLPHVCGSLTTGHHLEKLFLVYCRVLCWEKLGSGNTSREDEDVSSDDDSDVEGNADEAESNWEQCEHSVEFPESSPPTLLHYFTFLYGLYPLNFMSFIRKPRRYLKSLNFPGARDFELDQGFIHSRTEPYRKAHLLHPNMFNTTVEDELNDNRWSKCDPADVVIECMDLCVAASSTLHIPGPPPDAALPPVPDALPRLALDDDGATALGSEDSWRNTQSTMYVPLSDNAEVVESVATGPLLGTKSIKSAKSNRSLASPLLKSRDMMDSPTLPPTNAIEKQPLSVGADDNAKKLLNQSSLDDFAQAVSGTSSPLGTDFQNQTMGSLQREIMLLRNDLNFERYLKLQHLTHIGQLQRNNIKDATAEADTQNLINTNKTLKAKLAKANDLYAQLKKETLTSRSQSKKWESDLSAKVRTYKESEKSWYNEQGSLRHDLNRTQTDYDQLKQIVEKAEVALLKAHQRTKALEYELEDYGNVRRELEATQEKLLTFEDQRKELHALMRERNDLRNDLEIANMRLNSREAERERSMKAYERRILDLEARLQVSDRETTKPGQLSPAVQQMLDSALAASNAKLQQLKKTHYRLLEQHTELQMKCYELEGEQQAERGQMYPQHGGYADGNDARVSRNASLRGPNKYNTTYLPPLNTDSSEREQYLDHDPLSLNSPASAASPARPSRYELLQSSKPQRSQTTPLPYPGFGGGLGPDFSAAYDSSLNSQFQSRKAGNGAHSSGKSSFSVETEGSNGKEAKDKVEAKSEVRVYGRGGAQNIGKKVKDKEQKKPAKTGGFRGLKGIM